MIILRNLLEVIPGQQEVTLIGKDGRKAWQSAASELENRPIINYGILEIKSECNKLAIKVNFKF